MKNWLTTLISILFFSFSTYAQPNILIVIADDLGNDAIEGFGIDVTNFPNTPNLDVLKSEGISYMNTWAAPQCTPTRASIMSGKYGINTGVMRPPGNLDLEHESIFTYLDRETNNAYSTAVIGKWHISQPINIDHPFEHGADHYEGIIDGTINDYYDWEKVENGQYVQIDEYVTTHLTNAAINWVSNQNDPWFLWLAHIAPHSPFQVPPDSLHTVDNPTSNKQIYNASIEALDYEIGRLLDSMDEETRNNTLVIFIGDNGTPNGVLSGYPNQHGKGSMYEGGIRVPMIISGNGVTRAGQQEFGLTQVNDLYATLAEVGANMLSGGIHNSYSIQASFQQENAIERDYVYSDYMDDGIQYWAVRNNMYKLIQNDSGDKEFYRIDTNTDEEENLINNLTTEESEVLADLEAEAEAIRSGWSCRDFILNGTEIEIDDCNTNSTECPEVDVLSADNIGCCDSPDEPSVYNEYEENNLRHIYSNGFPNHDYCYNPNNIPGQSYHYFRVDIEPQLTNEITSIVRTNGRPARHFGVALNGVFLSPAPGTPFIYTNKNTGEFNWDWVYEPTNNQGDGLDQVRLDCASAHTNGSGYHYHGEMFQYLETASPGITSITSSNQLYQVGWAADGFPVLYKFGPDINGQIKELTTSFQLKSGERPGDGIVAPCGPYTGKYSVDYEFVQGLGDLDECNGIASEITLETALGTETFEYYYVVTSSFPQIGRCLKGNVSLDFENSADPITGEDKDGDGYLAQFECDDTNPDINPSQTEIPYNGLDDDCDTATLDDDLDQDGFLLVDDCDDDNSDINPDQTEIPYNGLDDDCDTATLDDDLDQDGFLLVDDCDDDNSDINPDQTEIPYNGLDDDCDTATLDDDLDQDGFLLVDDCDDTNSDINPSQTEIPYNGLDDDCDTATLDDDLDQDGFLLVDDCDDDNSDINPSQTEIPYNGLDDDCDTATLDDDLDQDGFLLVDDCDDTNSDINPSQTEIPYNGLDDDCDTATLDDDLDQDGFLLVDDCDDDNSDINPSQTEIPYNGLDDDCDTATLDDDLDQDGFLLVDDCDDDNSDINPSQTEIPYNGLDDDCDTATLDDDLDQDGFLLVDDCDDDNSDINPSQTEIPYNGLDDDCDTATLDDDLDQDGFLLVDDCDDTNSDINPDADEIPNNGIDEDCDGMDLVSSIHELSNLTINIFPNPAINLINIDVNGKLNYQVNFYNLEGKLIKSSNNSKLVEIDTIPSGTYLLEIKDLQTGQGIIEKIVIGR